MSRKRNLRRRSPGYVQREKDDGREVVSHNRFVLETLKSYCNLYAKGGGNPWELARIYPLFFQCRLAKYFHRKKTFNLTLSTKPVIINMSKIADKILNTEEGE